MTSLKNTIHFFFSFSHEFIFVLHIFLYLLSVFICLFICKCMYILFNVHFFIVGLGLLSNYTGISEVL